MRRRSEMVEDLFGLGEAIGARECPVDRAVTDYWFPPATRSA